MGTDYIIKQIREMISQPLYSEDGLGEFDRYLIQIENNLDEEPNICLEACKALAEGIFRHILDHDKIEGQFKDVLSSSRAETVSLYKNTYQALDSHTALDIELAKCGHIFFKTIGEVRNSTGLISHGRDLAEFPNLAESTVRHVVFMTISYVIFLLDAYVKIIDLNELQYEDNEDFNEYLDNDYDLSGIRYSLAMFEQDRVSYEEQLDEYNSAEHPEE